MIELLFPAAAQLSVDAILPGEDRVDIHARRDTLFAVCPVCQVASTRTHSCYQRHPHDLPCLGFRVQLHLTVRRFFCDNERCSRRTFAEPFPELLQYKARRTERLNRQHLSVAFAVSAEAGRRLLRLLAMPISGDTLIRDIRRAPEADVVTPSVLGIDDWAQRRGQTYGTILVDLESSRPIDLLNSREAQAVITWLEEHHGVKIISRDRSNEYIYAATTAAPQAEQVADRWHLLKNLRESLETMLLHKPTVLRAAAGATVAIESAGMEEISPNLQETQAKQEHALAPPEWTKAAQNKAARQQRRQARYERVRQLHEAGHTTRDIARQTGLARRTVQKYIAAETCPQYPEGRLRASKMHPWMPYMEQRWQEGCTNASQLWREINAQGFSGSRSLVSRWAAKERSLLSKPRRYRRQQPKHVTPALSRQENPRPWSPQRASWLLVKDRDQLDDNERNVLARMMATDEQVAIASRLSERFVRMVKQQDADELQQWLKDTTTSGVRALVSLANGIRQDFAAVKNALRLPWSNGPVEGHINRLKFIKRMMFGRANFDLLRKRVLYRCPGSAP